MSLGKFDHAEHCTNVDVLASVDAPDALNSQKILKNMIIKCLGNIF